MSKIRLFGTSSGYVEIAPAAAAGNNTLTAPNTVGEIIAKDAAGAIGITSMKASNVNVGAAVTITESGIEASGIGITCASINGGQIGGRRNIIINGAMQVAQRGTSTSSWSGIGFPACDRQKTLGSYGGTWTISQSTEAPSDNGFTKSTKYDCTTAVTSLNANAYLQHYYRVEGHDLQGVCKGTSNAKALTLSFWVKTNKTGTYNVEAIDQDNSRLCSFSYTVSDTNWNKYIITFPADTTGAFGDDNGASLDIGWWLVAGSTFNSGSNQNTFGSFTQGNRAPSNVNLADSTSNEWYITGIQLELGSEATAFEHRTFNDEFSLCQRYFQKYACTDQEWIYVEGNGAQYKWWQSHFNPMRSTPTVDISGLSTGSGTSFAGGAGEVSSLAVTSTSLGASNGRVSYRVTGSTTWGTARTLHHTDVWDGEFVTYSAEL